APKPLHLALYGQSDGVRLAGRSSSSSPRIAKSNDGRIWICTDDGLAIVDPARIRASPVPPPVAIDEVMLDGQRLDTNAPRKLAFRGKQLHITYTGLSLTLP